eukprot:366490-Chlamydomonas_euryale.AAC.29
MTGVQSIVRRRRSSIHEARRAIHRRCHRAVRAAWRRARHCTATSAAATAKATNMAAVNIVQAAAVPRLMFFAFGGARDTAAAANDSPAAAATAGGACSAGAWPGCGTHVLRWQWHRRSTVMLELQVAREVFTV